MKGVVLAGGKGTRLRPLTYVANKHLLPVYNKPMIYYPLETLVSMGCDDILLVSGGENIGGFADLLKDGSGLGVTITYRAQVEAGGIAQALKIADGFVPHDSGQQVVPVILGDNYFSDPVPLPKEQAIVVCSVPQPTRFGVYHNRAIEEKPQQPKSDLAVTGLYFYEPKTFSYPQHLYPSARGELEITDVNNFILKDPNTKVIKYKGYWSDMGTFDSLLEVANRAS